MVLAACFGDPPPAAADLPLEIVVRPDACVLNYARVGPGHHEVAVIHEAEGTVRIEKDGVVVFEDDGATSHVRLDTGDYVVECVTPGEVYRLGLSVQEGLPPGG